MFLKPNEKWNQKTGCYLCWCVSWHWGNFIYYVTALPQSMWRVGGRAHWTFVFAPPRSHRFSLFPTLANTHARMTSFMGKADVNECMKQKWNKMWTLSRSDRDVKNNHMQWCAPHANLLISSRLPRRRNKCFRSHVSVAYFQMSVAKPWGREMRAVCDVVALLFMFVFLFYFDICTYEYMYTLRRSLAIVGGSPYT